MGHDDESTTTRRGTGSYAVHRRGGWHRLLEAVVEELPQMVFVKDADDLRFVLVNSATESLLGLGRDEMLGRTDLDLFPEEQARFFMAKDRAVLASGRMYDIESEPITARHGTRVLHTRKVPISDPETGEPQYLLGISEDITERREAQERTDEALREAGEADRARSEMLAVISHELRTPLTGMVGMATLLAQTPLNASQLEMVQVLQRASTRLHKLIGDLLDLSRLDSGHIKLEPVAFSPELAARDTLALFTQRAEDKEIALDVEISDTVPEQVVADSLRCQQVLMNLVSNAVRHTQVGHVTIRLKWSRDVLRFDVIDTGDGIDPTSAATLFEPFRRGDNAVGEGAGLGLAIARRLVSAMSGRIGAEARPRGGSRFFFEVPAPRSDEAQTGPTGCVLVVDDEAIGRRLAEVMLHGLGYQPVCVDNAEAALSYLANHRVDAVLLDCDAAGVDVPQLMRRLRGSTAVGRAAPFIAVSADELAGAEVDDRLPRPYGIHDLEAMLARWSQHVARSGR